ncbi:MULTISPECIES: hypothetical protein [unclassified Thiomonas]|uniref:hypothetical protein n=1 Tax=unclassified Thiomonas TaxID=2625466 RepID=UPI0012DEF283|nr:MULTISPECIES: hypothetical protein [unclassified Thiomonas]
MVCSDVWHGHVAHTLIHLAAKRIGQRHLTRGTKKPGALAGLVVLLIAAAVT